MIPESSMVVKRGVIKGGGRYWASRRFKEGGSCTVKVEHIKEEIDYWKYTIYPFSKAGVYIMPHGE